jgi:hypothetical protein
MPPLALVNQIGIWSNPNSSNTATSNSPANLIKITDFIAHSLLNAASLEINGDGSVKSMKCA